MAKGKPTRNSVSKTKKAAAPKKIISKKAAPKKAPAKRSISKAKPAAKPKAVKKEPVAPKRNAIAKSSGSKSLDLCLILDCTGSMYSWIQRSKDTLHKIIDHVKNENKGLTIRVAFVAYRDIKELNRFDVTDFTDNLDVVKANIQKQPATGGKDFPEDV